tara:strand:+ start:139 stop:282 length:144 start_codon:yes stop_codon:yes gene_type:complete
LCDESVKNERPVDRIGPTVKRKREKKKERRREEEKRRVYTLNKLIYM